MAVANEPALIEELQDYEDCDSSEEDDEIDEVEDTAEGGFLEARIRILRLNVKLIDQGPQWDGYCKI